MSLQPWTITSTRATLIFAISAERSGMHRGVDLISDALPFGRLWDGDANAVANAIGYAQFYSRAYHAVIRVYDAVGNVIETHEHTGEFKEW